MKNNLKLIIIAVLCMWMGQKTSAEEHYLVGGCTDSGWNAGSYNRIGVAMMKVNNTDTWVWYGKLTTGEGDAGRFKIPNSIGGWDGYWAPAQGTVLTSEWSDLSTSSNGDYKFCVAEEGLYKVTIDTSNKKIKAEKLTNAPSKDGDYYLIGSVADFCWFAAYVATNETNASKARLTEDLDFSTDGFFPLGSDKHKFKGEIDGAGHTLKGINVVEDYGFTALVRYATGGAYIHDLVIEGSFSGGRKVAGVIGFARDSGEITLTNVVNKANVTATGGANGDEGNAAGLVACATDETKITALNCANMGEVRGQDGQCAAFIGWSQPGTTFTNCWNSGSIYNMENNCNLYRNTGAVTATNCYDANGADFYTQGTKVANSTIASGEFCYTLNGDQSSINWYQNLSETIDAYPVPFSSHAQVYANGRLYCDGTAYVGSTFENVNKGIVRDEHHYMDGFCDNENGSSVVCNDQQMNYLTPVEGYYSLENAKHLKWFAVYVNTKDNTVNAKLTADIDFSEQAVMIGNADNEDTAYKGTFDGQGHKVTLGYTRSEKHGALFMYLYGGSVVRNLVTDGSITMTGAQHGSGIFGGSRGNALVENCVSYVTIKSTVDGDATMGGIGAYMFDTGTIRNCAFLGTIDAENANGNGGILGYANGGANVNIQNCYVNATINVKFVENSSKIITRNTATLTNCYYGGSMGNMENYITGSSTPQATEASVEVIGSGELAYLLNGGVSGGTSWYQVIGTDPQPLPIAKDGATVYANGYLYCDGLPKPGSAFENEEKEAIRDSHNFNDWGFCKNEHDAIKCDEIQPEFATLTDGFYQIGNAKELNWFAVWTNRKDATVNAKLTTNIDMTEVSNFPGIGSGENNFTGIFDGQRHIISNMKMDWDREGVGLVNRAADGAQVKNVTIASNCSFKGSKAVAGLIGGAYGTGDIYIENCGNEGSVTSTGQNAGGVVGVCLNNGGMIAHLTNVYNVGEITGATANESGSLSGWMANAVLKNCYSIAGYPTSENTHGFQQGNQFARGNGINLTNCYDFGTGDWGKNDGSWGSVFVGDHKIAEVNETNMGVVFAGLYDAEGGNVWRMEYDGWAHPVLYDPATLVLSENVPNRFVSQNGVDLTLKRTTVADTWNTICLPFALDEDGVKNLFGESAQVAKLTGSEGSTLHFTTVSTIDAGKAYLVKPSEEMTSKALTGVDLVEDAPEATTEGGYAFTGIYEPTTVVANDLFVAAENKLVPSNGEGKLKAFRAYFHNTTGAESRFTDFVIDNIATGLKTVMPAFTEVQGTVFDLQGRRTVRPVKGLYIVGGKKMVVK